MRNLRTRSGLFAALIIVAGVLSFGGESAAKTTVAKNGDECGYKVTVELAFAFLDQGAQDKADELIKIWSEQMSSTWNGPTGSQAFGECGCQVTFDFKIRKISAGKDCRQAPTGYHCLNVVDAPVNQRGNRADAQTVPPNGSWNGFGEWTTHTTGIDAVHEVGHLMGLADEYRYVDQDGDGTPETFTNDNVQVGSGGTPKDPQSVMAQTWGNVAALQSHIDDIMSATGLSCPASCCCGNGTVEDSDTVAEQCDNKAKPNGCGKALVCTDRCMCVEPPTEPKCGDGIVTAPEQCESSTKPSGCAADKQCVQCVCADMSVPETPPETPAPDDDEEEAPAVVAECGNQTCDADETCAVCPADCGECPPTCGNATCETGEACGNCLADCPCGQNEICLANECILPECFGDTDCHDQAVCTADMCRYPSTASAYCSYQTIEVCVSGDGCCPAQCSAPNDSDCPAQCGDTVCTGNETCESCAADCGACGPTCGDGQCTVGESCTTCTADCGQCPPVCGNGQCETGEDCYMCDQDCGTCNAPACNDGQDNDGDGLTDYPIDPGCDSQNDTSE